MGVRGLSLDEESERPWLESTQSISIGEVGLRPSHSDTHDSSHRYGRGSGRDLAAVGSPLRLWSAVVDSQAMGRRLFPELPNESCRNIVDRHTGFPEQLRIDSGGRQHPLDATAASRDGSPRSQRAPRCPRPPYHLLSGCSSLLRSNYMVCSVETGGAHGNWTWIFGRPSHLDDCNFWGHSRPWDAQRERVSHRPDTNACHWTGLDLETQVSWRRLDDGSGVRRTVLAHLSTGQIPTDGSRWRRAMSASQGDDSIGQDHGCSRNQVPG